MKRSLLVLAILFILPFLDIGCKPEHYKIIDIYFSGASIEELNNNPTNHVYKPTSIFTEKVTFVLCYDVDFVAQAPSPNLINECRATTWPRKIDNPVLRESYSITFDKPFVFRGDTISSEINLFEIDGLKDEISIYENHMIFAGTGRSPDEVIDFSEQFNEDAKFEEGIYKVIFSCMTSDSLYFNKSIDIEFKMKK